MFRLRSSLAWFYEETFRWGLLYWETNDQLIDYFMMHHMFETLMFIDEACANEWHRSENVSSLNPHKLQKAMHQRFDPKIAGNILDAAFVQKMTYKYK